MCGIWCFLLLAHSFLRLPPPQPYSTPLWPSGASVLQTSSLGLLTQKDDCLPIEVLAALHHPAAIAVLRAKVQSEKCTFCWLLQVLSCFQNLPALFKIDIS